VCSPGYIWALTGIGVSSGVRESGKTETGKQTHGKRERASETLESKLRGMFRAAEEKRGEGSREKKKRGR